MFSDIVTGLGWVHGLQLIVFICVDINCFNDRFRDGFSDVLKTDLLFLLTGAQGSSSDKKSASVEYAGGALQGSCLRPPSFCYDAKPPHEATKLKVT